MRELILAGFMIAVGLCVAGAGTHLYQWISRQRALLRWDGRTYAEAMGHLMFSAVCGPYIMLLLGFRQESGDLQPMGTTLFASFIAFGWAFITGLVFIGLYVALRP